jgi:hypothetical protein
MSEEFFPVKRVGGEVLGIHRGYKVGFRVCVSSVYDKIAAYLEELSLFIAY